MKKISLILVFGYFLAIQVACNDSQSECKQKETYIGKWKNIKDGGIMTIEDNGTNLRIKDDNEQDFTAEIKDDCTLQTTIMVSISYIKNNQHLVWVNGEYEKIGGQKSANKEKSISHSNLSTENWDDFWTLFTNAVKEKDKKMLVELALKSEEFESCDGCRDLNCCLEGFEKHAYWYHLDEAINKGVESINTNMKKTRGDHNSFSFRRENDKWYWAGFCCKS